MVARGLVAAAGEQVGEERLEDAEALGRERAGRALELLRLGLGLRPRRLGRLAFVALENAVEPCSHFVDQLRWRERPRPAFLAENPAGQQVEARVRGREGAVGDLAALDHALDPPGGVRVELDLGLALRLAELPRLSAAEVGRVVLGHAKVALAAGREADVADDARDAERPLVVLGRGRARSGTRSPPRAGARTGSRVRSRVRLREIDQYVNLTVRCLEMAPSSFVRRPDISSE